MAFLKASYVGTELSEENISVYYNGLAQYGFDVVYIAVKRIVETSEYFPRLATIKKEIAKIENNISDNTLAEATELLLKTIRNFGRYRSIEALEYIKSNDITLYNIVKAMGYGSICQCEGDFVTGKIGRLYIEEKKEGLNKLMLTEKTKLAIESFKNKALCCQKEKTGD